MISRLKYALFHDCDEISETIGNQVKEKEFTNSF